MSVVIELRSKTEKLNNPASHLGGFKNQYLGSWWETGTDMPSFGRVYSRVEQRSNEREMDRAIANVLSDLRKYPAYGVKLKLWSSKIRENVRSAGRFLLQLTDSYLEMLLDGGFLKATDSFFRDARLFDSGLGINEVLQALRNVWIMNSIQALFGEEVYCSPSVFAYSMLYPYSDNYMDSGTITSAEKFKISKRFGMRLAGSEIRSENECEDSLFRLISMIEDQYPRENFPEVYESLLAIHSAQEKSLSQQTSAAVPYEADILGISFEKGGASVMADAFLVKGRLSMEEAFHMFGFGIFLQLSDDLQDVEADLKNGHMTIFSQIAGKWSLDSLTNRLFNFIAKVIESWAFTSSESDELKRVIRNSCNFLLTTAIAQNKRFFSKDYLKYIEKHSLLSLNYLAKLQRNAVREYSNLKNNFSGYGREPLETVISCIAENPVPTR